MVDVTRPITSKTYFNIRNLVGHQKIIDESIACYKTCSDFHKDPWVRFGWVYGNVWRELWIGSTLNKSKKHREIAAYTFINKALTQAELDYVSNSLNIKPFDLEHFKAELA